MLVRDFMTSLIVTSEAETPVKEAAKLMAAEDIGSLIVTKGDLLAGMVTRKEIIGARLLSDDAYFSLTVEDVMTSPVITISPDADLGQTIAVMNQAGSTSPVGISYPMPYSCMMPHGCGVPRSLALPGPGSA